MLAFLSSFPQNSPICLSDPTLMHLVLFPHLSSCSSPYFALCLLFDNINVVFNSFSALTLNFTCLFYSFLPFTSRGKRMPVSCCIFRLVMRWLFWACGRELTVSPTAQAVAWGHWLFWIILCFLLHLLVIQHLYLLWPYYKSFWI